MTRRCPYCDARITATQDAIDYAEELWCSTDCIALDYIENKEVYDRAGKGPRDIEAAIHTAVVFEYSYGECL